MTKSKATSGHGLSFGQMNPNELKSQFDSQLKKLSSYTLVKLGKMMNTLPMGIQMVQEDEGGNVVTSILRNIKFRVMTKPESKLLRDENYSRNHPFLWVARVICLVTESIEGFPVYESFKASNYKVIPPIVRSIVQDDANYILFRGHMENYGSILEGLQAECIEDDCRHKNIIPEFNLEDLNVEYAEDTSELHTIEVNLTKPFKYETKDPGKDVISVIDYNKLIFKPIELGDYIKYEKHYTPNNQSDFEELVQASALLDVVSVDGISMEDNQRNALHETLFTFMSAQHGREINAAFTKIPQLLTFHYDSCAACSADLPILIKPNFLFPR